MFFQNFENFLDFEKENLDVLSKVYSKYIPMESFGESFSNKKLIFSEIERKVFGISAEKTWQCCQTFIVRVQGAILEERFQRHFLTFF